MPQGELTYAEHGLPVARIALRLHDFVEAPEALAMRQFSMTRRSFLTGFGSAVGLDFTRGGAGASEPVDATFVFIADVHACRMTTGLSPNCQQEGKTDENLRRHIAALNSLPGQFWPGEIDGKAIGLASAGEVISTPLGVVVGGDMTDDGGGQVAMPSEGTQLLQFSQRYQQGVGPDRIHFPVFTGLGNHDLDQDGPPGHVDWYRRQLRDYVEINHRPGVFFHPLVPADDYDVDSDCYSWSWGGLHLVQCHRFAGDATKGSVNALPWLKRNLATRAADGRPVVLFQHYGWDPFSIERWDKKASTFDDEGAGSPHWWSDADRQAIVEALQGYNVIAVFHGHQHETPMIYQADGLDIFKPKAAYMGGFAMVRIKGRTLDVVLGEAGDDPAEAVFTNAFTKQFA